MTGPQKTGFVAVVPAKAAVVKPMQGPAKQGVQVQGVQQPPK